MVGIEIKPSISVAGHNVISCERFIKYGTPPLKCIGFRIFPAPNS